MRKILSVLAVILAVVLCSFSCREQHKKNVTQNKKVDQKELFLKEGKHQLNEYIKDNFRNPDETKISDMQIVELRDSLCILNFRFITENGYGGHINGKAQFIFLTHNKQRYISFMTNHHDSPHCVGSNWLGEATGLLAYTLPMEYEESDSLVKKICCKEKDVFDGTDKYIQAYCIVKKFGKNLDLY